VPCRSRARRCGASFDILFLLLAGDFIMVRQTRFDLAVFAALAAVMLVTRTHSLSAYIHVPDTSWASFFVAGFYIRSRLGFPALFALGFAIDVVVISLLGGSGFCFTPAYWMLLPAYGVMWFAGRFAAAHVGARAAALPAIAGIVTLATLGGEMLSSGGFYFLGGRFADPTLAGFLPRIGRYFPSTLLATLGWTGFAAAVHAVIVTLRPEPRADRAR
jgi:hypothetical protein